MEGGPPERNEDGKAERHPQRSQGSVVRRKAGQGHRPQDKDRAHEDRVERQVGPRLPEGHAPHLHRVRLVAPERSLIAECRDVEADTRNRQQDSHAPLGQHRETLGGLILWC